jgi:hypothetical protein
MKAWRDASPYSSVAIYIGGEMRGCPNSALDSPAWVNSVLDQGWGVIPVYVSRQAPCSDFHVRMSGDPAAAGWDGFYAGIDSVVRARAAGVTTGSPIYLDIESWDVDDPACSAAVGAFMSSWDMVVHGNGFLAGIYSTPRTGIAIERDLEGNPSMYHADLVWVANWTGTPGGTDAFAGNAWAGGRVHQYAGDHSETWGGVKMEVDSDWVDAPTLTRGLQAAQPPP